jgi:hypothetical protein
VTATAGSLLGDAATVGERSMGWREAGRRFRVLLYVGWDQGSGGHGALARQTRALAVLAVALAAAACASVDLVPGHGPPDATEVNLRPAADPFPGD